ncbi:hypothetical protein ACPOL_0597 [Acidisarcina polymorpha]|uniref:ABM domain-containing protein n=1 Tax=Acidisarcina polymorpha TaxID=2211140 RepID=A0A2Z5FT10_9BACT|nr:putative quinol monooxygenase [Acidisarcina polymorpha]AXC09968.1 hypothetical protein ACPOL_0597 [Acidisarcina polymorpha]
MNKSKEATTLLYLVQAKREKEIETRDLLLSLVTASRYEPGNIAYETYEITNRPGMFAVHSIWISDEALDAHHATELVQRAMAAFSDLADGEFSSGLHFLAKVRPPC